MQNNGFIRRRGMREYTLEWFASGFVGARCEVSLYYINTMFKIKQHAVVALQQLSFTSYKRNEPQNNHIDFL